MPTSVGSWKKHPPPPGDGRGGRRGHSWRGQGAPRDPALEGPCCDSVYPLSCLASQTPCEFAVARQCLGRTFRGSSSAGFHVNAFPPAKSGIHRALEAARASVASHEPAPARPCFWGPPCTGAVPAGVPRPVPVTVAAAASAAAVLNGLAGLAEPGAGSFSMCDSAAPVPERVQQHRPHATRSAEVSVSKDYGSKRILRSCSVTGIVRAPLFRPEGRDGP